MKICKEEKILFKQKCIGSKNNKIPRYGYKIKEEVEDMNKVN